MYECLWVEGVTMPLAYYGMLECYVMGSLLGWTVGKGGVGGGSFKKERVRGI